jgi:hypothetical protein
MTAKSLFLIILKVIGILFLRDFLVEVPQFISMISMTVNGYDSALSPLFAILLSVGIFGYLAYLLLFRTEWLIEKLNLLSGIDEDVFSFHLHRSATLTIVVLIIGAMMVVDAVPLLVRQLLLLFQYARIQSGFPNLSPKPDYSLLITYAVQWIAGLVIIGYQRRIVSYLELKRRETAIEQPVESDPGE